MEKEIIVETDVFDYAIGACINQRDNEGRIYLVMFYFRKLLLVKENYNIHDKKLLAIVDIFKV